MMVTFVSQCEKNALKKTRRVLDAFANRIGDNTWQTLITEDGLLTVKKMLRQTASRSTAVSCHWIRSRSRSKLLWVVGNKSKFNNEGVVPVNSTAVPVDRYSDKHQWMTVNIIAQAAAIAGLFHDFGKANRLFQNKIDPSKKTASFEPYRHEWVSLRLFQAFVGDKSDKQWLEELSEIDIDANSDCFKDGVDIGFGSHPILSLPNFAKLVAWIIVSHHHLPLVPKWQGNISVPKLTNIDNWLSDAFDAQWNSYRCKDKEQGYRVTENWQFSVKALPYNSRKWRCHASITASETLEKRSQWSNETADYINDHLFTSHLARLCMMLADRYYSSQSDTTKKWRSRDYVVYANTYGKGEARTGFKQQLDEHLIGVAYHSERIAKKLPKLKQSLLSLTDVEFLTTSVDKQNKKKYGWQDKATKLVSKLSVDTKTSGFFGINMASTGGGKTIANAKIMYALGQETGQVRFSVALGLRTLTLQTGRVFKKDIDLSDEQLAIAVGGVAVKQLFEHAHQQTDIDKKDVTGSESADETLNDELYVYYSGEIEHSLSEWTKHDKNIDKLLCAPVLVCTIDHLISATEGTKGGRQTAAMLRLLTADLVLDEPDDFGLEDLPALCRLVHWAGMLGSRILLSTATMPPALAFALFEAYRNGWQQYAKANISDWKGDICCAWFDEFATSDYKHRSIADLDTYKLQHNKFVTYRIKALSDGAIDGEYHKRLGEIADVENTQSSTLAGALAVTIHTKITQLHRSHHVSKNEKHLSIGLVRMANINPLVSVAKALMAMDAPSYGTENDTCIHVCVYHSRYPLAIRSHIEQQLDTTLNRKDPDALWQSSSAVGRVLEQHPQKNHIFVVLASPVAEVGRDHDYDWAIVEPSSMRSIIQLAGRVLRHRDIKPSTPNIVLLNRNYKALKKEDVCFNRPGFEMPGLTLATHNLDGLLHLTQYQSINAIPRITLPDQQDYVQTEGGKYINLNGLEHKALAWQLFSGENKAKVWWDSNQENKPYWCGEVQRQQRFRNSQKDEAYYLWFESHHAKPYWRWLNENVKPAIFGEVSCIEINELSNLTLGNGVCFWFDQSPDAVYQTLSDELDMDLLAVSTRFAELRITEYEGSHNQYYYHNNLGLYQEREDNE